MSARVAVSYLAQAVKRESSLVPVSMPASALSLVRTSATALTTTAARSTQPVALHGSLSNSNNSSSAARPPLKRLATASTSFKPSHHSVARPSHPQMFSVPTATATAAATITTVSNHRNSDAVTHDTAPWLRIDESSLSALHGMTRIPNSSPTPHLSQQGHPQEKYNPESARLLPAHRNITGAGVIVLDTTTQSVLLFENAERHCYEEPGGFVKANSDPATSASTELFEESCTLIRETKSSFLPEFVDVPGRSDNTTYRGYFMVLHRSFSPLDFLERRIQLEQEGYPSDFLEMKGMVFIPLGELARAVASSSSTPLQQPSSPTKATESWTVRPWIMVKDRNGVDTPVSARTVKILREGGLEILQHHCFDPVHSA